LKLYFVWLGDTTPTLSLFHLSIKVVIALKLDFVWLGHTTPTLGNYLDRR
jgi:hypothetical protein